jgi:hypothetical protein
MHALHFLKEGLANNEFCVLITSFPNKENIRQILRDLWNSYYQIGSITPDDLMIISASEWYFDNQEGTKMYTNELLKSFFNFSNNATQNGNTRLRAFIDMSFFFKHQLVEVLVECESKFNIVPTFPLKLICAYLESDVASLSTNTYNILQEHHKHVYLIPE